MLDWKFVQRKFLRDNKYTHDLNAPAVWAMKDTLYVFGSTWEQDFRFGKVPIPPKTTGKLLLIL
jgi:hypothetical protein